DIVLEKVLAPRVALRPEKDGLVLGRRQSGGDQAVPLAAQPVDGGGGPIPEDARGVLILGDSGRLGIAQGAIRELLELPRGVLEAPDSRFHRGKKLPRENTVGIPLRMPRDELTQPGRAGCG